MINGKSNPVEWALLSYEIEELIEHLQELSSRITPASEIDEHEFEVLIGHSYAHLNRIWNSRSHTGEITQKHSDEFTKFPEDVRLFG